MARESFRFVKGHLPEILDRVHAHQERVIITRDGRPVAAIVDVNDLASLEATIEVLSDPATMSRLAESEKAVAAGHVVALDELNELLAGAARHGRAEA